jgi:hypothetical protein
MKTIFFSVLFILISANHNLSLSSENNEYQLKYNCCKNGLYGSSPMVLPCHQIEIILQWKIYIGEEPESDYIEYFLKERFPGYIVLFSPSSTYYIRSSDTKYYPGKIVHASGRVRQDWFNLHVDEIISINKNDLRARVSEEDCPAIWRSWNIYDEMTENTVPRPSFSIYMDIPLTLPKPGTILTVIQPSVVEINNVDNKINYQFDYIELKPHPIMLEYQLFNYKEIKEFIHTKKHLNKKVEIWPGEKDQSGHLNITIKYHEKN